MNWYYAKIIFWTVLYVVNNFFWLAIQISYNGVIFVVIQLSKEEGVINFQVVHCCVLCGLNPMCSEGECLEVFIQISSPKGKLMSNENAFKIFRTYINYSLNLKIKK